jgi:hypothetical protein
VFTFGAVILVSAIAWYASRMNDRERPAYDRTPSQDAGLWVLLLHIRQDLKLVSFSLAGVIVMLGIIADRLH